MHGIDFVGKTLYDNTDVSCEANKLEDGKVLTICFHLDDCKISQRSSKVVDDTIVWFRDEYDVIFEVGKGTMKVH